MCIAFRITYLHKSRYLRRQRSFVLYAASQFFIAYVLYILPPYFTDLAKQFCLYKSNGSLVIKRTLHYKPCAFLCYLSACLFCRRFRFFRVTHKVPFEDYQIFLFSVGFAFFPLSVSLFHLSLFEPYVEFLTHILPKFLV